jgi:metal-responsive CopG/Arc/MetJ family transcriptional regulator
MSDTITVKLSKKIQKELDVVTRTEKVTRSEFIKEALTRYIAVKRFHQLKKQVLPFAEAEGLLTDEDIFKAIS